MTYLSKEDVAIGRIMNTKSRGMAVLAILSKHGVLRPTEIMECLEISRQHCSNILKRLRDLKLVESTGTTPFVYYELTEKGYKLFD